jgi:hypothetical protein
MALSRAARTLTLANSRVSGPSEPISVVHLIDAEDTQGKKICAFTNSDAANFVNAN